MDADGAEGRRQLQGNLPIKSGKVVVAAEIRSTSLFFQVYEGKRGGGVRERGSYTVLFPLAGKIYP